MIFFKAERKVMFPGAELLSQTTGLYVDGGSRSGMSTQVTSAPRAEPGTFLGIAAEAINIPPPPRVTAFPSPRVTAGKPLPLPALAASHRFPARVLRPLLPAEERRRRLGLSGFSLFPGADRPAAAFPIAVNLRPRFLWDKAGPAWSQRRP